MLHMITIDEPSPAVNANDAAEILGVHPETLRRWVREGRIPAVKVGARLRISRATINDLLTHGTPTPDEMRDE